MDKKLKEEFGLSDEEAVGMLVNTIFSIISLVERIDKFGKDKFTMNEFLKSGSLSVRETNILNFIIDIVGISGVDLRKIPFKIHVNVLKSMLAELKDEAFSNLKEYETNNGN